MTTNKQRVAILWNPAAGWDDGQAEAEQVRSILAAEGDPVELVMLQKGDDITARARERVADGNQILVAAGGDGTINAVASGLVNSPASLAVVPAGTLNHFARDLSIPLEPPAAAALIRHGRQIQVGVGAVNGRIFINNSVLGLYPIYRAAREAYERKGLGRYALGRFFAVLRAIARVFWHLPHLDLSIELGDGSRRLVRTPFVLIANDEHELEHWNIGHRRAIQGGRLWVYVMRRCSRWGVLRFFAAFLLKKFSKHDAFDMYQARSLSVSTRSAHLRAGVDGEIVRFRTPLQYEALPGALQVIAPPGYLPEPNS
jgi:diacylglycerol kinase family enzyme